MNIAIIGCGNIGFRHFQSILKLKKNYQLFLVDDSSTALNKCKKYCSNDQNKKQSIFFLDNIRKVSSNLDVIIIATSSFPRRRIIEEVFKDQKPKYIILEKFLFPKIEDYEFCNDLFKSNKTKVWVNQWMSDEFSEINQYFPSNKNLNFSINGKNWGLCSNSVHFIDWFHSMIGREKLEIDYINLNNEISESRREDYHELLGSYKIRSVNGHTLNLKCEKKSKYEKINERSIYIDISNIDYEFKAEFDGTSLSYKIKNKNINKNSFFEKKIIAKPQGEKTSGIVKDLIDFGTCNLVDYHISMEQHLLIFNMLQETFAANGYNIKNGIPVT